MRKTFLVFAWEKKNPIPYENPDFYRRKNARIKNPETLSEKNYIFKQTLRLDRDEYLHLIHNSGKSFKNYLLKTCGKGEYFVRANPGNRKMKDVIYINTQTGEFLFL